MLYFELLMVSTNFAAPSTHNRDVIKMTIPAQYVKARYKLLFSITEECSTSLLSYSFLMMSKIKGALFFMLVHFI